MNDPILSSRLWLLTKASADEERAKHIESVYPRLAKLMRDDARQARAIAESLTTIRG